MEKSITISKLAQALCEFHKRVSSIKRDASNPFFKSKYATLSNILDNIDKPLEESGLVVTQFPNGDNGLTSILIHAESGEYIQSTYNMHPTKNDPQSIGSAITYARRYALGAILALNIEDDDDGNAASAKPQAAKQTTTANKTATDKPWLNPGTEAWKKVIVFLSNPEGTIEQVKTKYLISKPNEELLKQEALQTA